MSMTVLGNLARALAITAVVAASGALAAALASNAAHEPGDRFPDLHHSFVVPLVACEDCREPDFPQAPTNARVLAERCGAAVNCTHGGHYRITVTYLWPGGDPTTGRVAEVHAQTCIRWFAEPPLIEQVPPGYAFGGDCSTNVSGTTAEFRFTGAQPATFCAQVDAFIGSRGLGSSNLACVVLAPLSG